MQLFCDFPAVLYGLFMTAFQCMRDTDSAFCNAQQHRNYVHIIQGCAKVYIHLYTSLFTTNMVASTEKYN